MAYTPAQQSIIDAWNAAEKKKEAQIRADSQPVDKTKGTFGENPAWQQSWLDALANSPNGQPAPKPIFDPMLDPSYVAGASSTQRALDNAQGQHRYQFDRGAHDFGVSWNGDVLGSGSGGYNPFSQASILQHNFDNAKRGTTNSYAAQGQLYSGALQNAQTANAYNNTKSDNALKSAASDYYHSADASLTNAQDQGASNMSQLVANALQNFLASQRS